MVAWADTEVVRGSGIDVQLRRDAGLLQGQVCQDAVRGAADDISAAVHEKYGGPFPPPQYPPPLSPPSTVLQKEMSSCGPPHSTALPTLK